MSVDKEAMSALYEDVRDDSTPTSWAVFKYDGKIVKPAGSGVEYEEFLSHFVDEERVYGYVRLETGDELSKRAKFALITWVGSSVPAVKRAAVSTDKAAVKEVIKNYAKEILADSKDEITYATVKDQVVKCGGANYGVGSRKA